MNHDPKEHFSEEQLDIVTEIFHGEINKIWVKLNQTVWKFIGGNIVALLLMVGAFFTLFNRVDNVEVDVAAVVKSMSEGPRFTQDEGDALMNKHISDVEDLQRQIDAITSRSERMENKIDLILDRL